MKLLTRLLNETSSGKSCEYTDAEADEIEEMGFTLTYFFSLFPETLYFANEANYRRMGGQKARLFFKSIVPKKNRYAKWPKMDTKMKEDILLLSETLGMNPQRAKQMLPYMDEVMIGKLRKQKVEKEKVNE